MLDILPGLGKRLHHYGKSQFLMAKSTISMAIFNSYFSHYQGGTITITLYLITSRTFAHWLQGCILYAVKTDLLTKIPIKWPCFICYIKYKWENDDEISHENFYMFPLFRTKAIYPSFRCSFQRISATCLKASVLSLLELLKADHIWLWLTLRHGKSPCF